MPVRETTHNSKLRKLMIFSYFLIERLLAVQNDVLTEPMRRGPSHQFKYIH